MQRNVLIAGGTGLIGSAIHELMIRHGWNVTLLSRTPGPGKITWDPAANRIDIQQPASFDAIINLAGSSLAVRWSNAHQKEIVNSRINSCNTIFKYLKEQTLKAPVYVGASGVGIYRNSGSKQVDEYSPIEFTNDWLVDTVLKWENAHQQMNKLGLRVACLRTGIVLSTKGGALKEILKAGKFGMLPWFGSGQQIWPWIHINDMANIYFQCCTDPTFTGVFIAAAPNAITNKALVKAINHELHPRRITMGAPVFGLKLMLGTMHSVLLDSCNAYPKRLIENGYHFQFTEIKNAANDLLEKQRKN